MTGASSAAAAAAAAVAAELQQLLGRGQNEYNLAAVRARAIELRKDVVEVELALEARAGILKWDDVLKKFSVINTKASARPCPQQRRMCFTTRHIVLSRTAARPPPLRHDAPCDRSDVHRRATSAASRTSPVPLLRAERVELLLAGCRGGALQQQYGSLLDMVFDFDEFVASLVIQEGVLGSQDAGWLEALCVRNGEVKLMAGSFGGRCCQW
ncbi:MAG: hypothetical protein WDW36_008882 [Sanguina aurantia]